MFKILAAVSLLAILGGVFWKNLLGAELAAALVIGGAIIGSINVLVEFSSWFKK